MPATGRVYWLLCHSQETVSNPCNFCCCFLVACRVQLQPSAKGHALGKDLQKQLEGHILHWWWSDNQIIGMLKAFHSLLSEDDKPDDKPDAVNRDKLAFLAQLDVHVTPYLAPLKDDRCPGKEGLLVSNSLH